MNVDTRIAYRNLEGGVSIVSPTPEFCANPANTIGTLIRTLPLGVHFEVHQAEDIPTDRYFRNAWKLDAGISVDRAKAEKIHMDNLRVQRDEMLKSEDIEYQKALEMRDDAKMNAVANRKKKLRDMPTDTDLSSLSLDELKAFVPDVLK